MVVEQNRRRHDDRVEREGIGIAVEYRRIERCGDVGGGAAIEREQRGCVATVYRMRDAIRVPALNSTTVLASTIARPWRVQRAESRACEDELEAGRGLFGAYGERGAQQLQSVMDTSEPAKIRDG